MRFDEVAGELYGLPLKEFTAARTAAVAKARQDGEAETAHRIGELRKPTVPGWLANQLVRQRPDDVQALVDLGATLREAMRTLAGDQLKSAASRQHQAIYALVQQAKGIAEAAGQTFSESTRRDLENTLHAAIVDPEAGAELVAGRLTGPLSRSGFLSLLPAGDGSSPNTAPARGSSTAASDDGVEAARRAQAQRRAEAERLAQEAERLAQEAEQAVAEAEDLVRTTTERVTSLRGQLDLALEARTAAETDLSRLRREARAARRTADRLA